MNKEGQTRTSTETKAFERCPIDGTFMSLYGSTIWSGGSYGEQEPLEFKQYHCCSSCGYKKDFII